MKYKSRDFERNGSVVHLSTKQPKDEALSLPVPTLEVFTNMGVPFSCATQFDPRKEKVWRFKMFNICCSPFSNLSPWVARGNGEMGMSCTCLAAFILRGRLPALPAF